MADEKPKFKNQKESYATEEERFALLREIEDYVQSQTSDPIEQAKKRRQLIQDNPDIFYPLYKDYELSPKRKAELDALADKCTDRMILTQFPDRLYSFGNLTEKDKIALCKDIIAFVVRDADTKEFQTDLMHPINVIIKPLKEGLNGYRLGNEITINQNNLKLDEPPHRLFNTLLHETLHAFQKRGQGDFTQLSSLYYVNYSALKDVEGWKEKAYQAYQNQPIEKESRFFGSLAGELMLSGVGYSLTTAQATQKLVTTITDKHCSLDEAQKSKLTRGYFVIPLSSSSLLTQEDVPHFFGEGVGISSSSITFRVDKDEGAVDFRDHISKGTRKIQAALQDRDQFKQKIQILFPKAKPIKIQKDGLLLEGSNPEIQQWIRSMGTNVKAISKDNGDLWIFMPLILKKDGQQITYTQAFPEQYTHLADPKGFNYRVLMGGDKKPIIPESLKEHLSSETKPVSNHDLLRGAANGGQGQGGEPPMDKHNGLDYRDVGGKKCKPEIPRPTPDKSQENDAVQKRAEEIRQQREYEAQLAAKRGHSL